MTDTEQSSEVIYRQSLIEKPVVDPTRYKAEGRSGRGRPRKSDYTTIPKLMKKHNSIINKHLDAKKLEMFPPLKLNK